MPALVYLVEVDEVVIRTFCPAPRGLVVLTGKDADGSRDGRPSAGLRPGAARGPARRDRCSGLLLVRSSILLIVTPLGLCLNDGNAASTSLPSPVCAARRPVEAALPTPMLPCCGVTTVS